MATTAERVELIKFNGKQHTINTLSRIEIEEYTAQSLEATSRRLLKHLKTADLDKASLNAVAVTLGICIDKARLIRGQSTSNTAVSGRVDAIHRVQVLSGRLEQALHGRDGSSKMLVSGNAEVSDNGDYCEKPIQAGDPQVIEAEVVAQPEQVASRKASRYVPTGRPKGRPRKAQATPTP